MDFMSSLIFIVWFTPDVTSIFQNGAMVAYFLGRDSTALCSSDSFGNVALGKKDVPLFRFRQ